MPITTNTLVTRKYLDTSIQVETPDCDTLRFILPIRPFKVTRKQVFGYLLGLVGIEFAFVLHSGDLLFNPQNWLSLSLLNILADVIILGISSIPLIISLALMLPNHTEITLTPTHLRSRFCLYRWHFQNRCKREQISRFHIRYDKLNKDKTNTYWQGIYVYRDQKIILAFARGYPMELLVSLAHELSERCQPQSSTEFLTPSIICAVPVVMEETDPQRFLADENWPKPANCKIQCLEQETQCTFFVPKSAKNQKAKAHFISFIIFMIGLALTIYGICFNGGPLIETTIPEGLFCVLCGGLVFLYYFNLRHTKWVFLTSASSLDVIRSTLVRKKYYHWPIDDLAGLEVDCQNQAEGIYRKESWVIKVIPKANRYVVLFPNNNLREIMWLTAQLRNQLHLPRQTMDWHTPLILEQVNDELSLGKTLSPTATIT